MGYLQDQIIRIGREKGFVFSTDVSRFYQPSKIQQEMNKLVALGYFGEPEDCGTMVKWIFKR